MEKLFVQFINNGPLCREKFNPFYVFQNGLSSAWDRFKNEGDLIWIEPTEQIPSFNGNVYVSGWFYQDMVKTFTFAKNNPESSVVLGGPIVSQALHNTTFKTKNIKILKGDAEKNIFGNCLKTSRWNLEIPEKYNDAHISWTYPVDKPMTCYWGKCTFCQASQGFNETKINEIPILEIGKSKSIWLGSLCLHPISIYKAYSIAPKRDDVFYYSYVRPTKQTADIIKKSNVFGEQYNFVCGIEYPGNRMLKWMNKGTTTEEQLYTIKTLTGLGCEVYLNFIVDWINITDEDLNEAEEFFNQLQKIENKNLSAKIYKFHIKVHSKMMEIYKGNKKIVKNSLGDLEHYLPILNEKELELNKKLRKLYCDFPWVSLDIHQTWR